MVYPSQLLESVCMFVFCLSEMLAEIGAGQCHWVHAQVHVGKSGGGMVLACTADQADGKLGKLGKVLLGL